MNKDEIYWDYIKIGVVILSILSPFLYMVIAQELLPSLSSYWRTPAQPLFVITNASVSYFLFNVKGWRASSVLLLLLTAFSIDHFPITHNVLAVFFFLLLLGIVLFNFKLYYTPQYKTINKGSINKGLIAQLAHLKVKMHVKGHWGAYTI